MKKIYILLLTTLGINQGWAQFTSVPDANFEQYLVDFGYDDLVDGQFLTANASGINYLDLSYRSISSLEGIKAFTDLKGLYCYGNNLSNLDLSGMISLNEVNCSHSYVSSLNITGLTQLTDLDCGYNELTALDLSGNSALKELTCNNNQLSALAVANNTNLIKLYCSSNQLTSLNVNGLIHLKYFDCSDNQLLNLDIKGLTVLQNLSCYGNPLTCITVDNAAAAMAQTSWFKDYSASYNTTCALPGMILIPDPAFEQALIDLGYDTVIDGMATLAAINGITTLDVSSKGITSLAGIEGFTALQNLKCDGNQLTSLDLTVLTTLITINCNNNLLTDLRISNLTNLNQLYCTNNQLKNLNLSGLYYLQTLDCSDNSLTLLDLSYTGLLTSLSFSNNAINTVNVNHLNSLATLNCSGNGLENLTIGNLTNLVSLDCQNNVLTELDLTGLNMTSLSVLGNPLLACINVADPVAAEANTNWLKDPTASYNSSCVAPLFFAVPDANFEQALIDLGFDDTIDGKVVKANVTAVTSLNVASKSIVNLTGIKYFTGLTTLDCSNNGIVSLDTNNMATSLITLNCGTNHINTLSVNTLSNLQSLNASNNELTSLSMDAATALSYVNLDSNLLTQINIDPLVNLEELHFSANNVTNFDTPPSPLPGLKKLYCSGNKLNYLEITNLQNLEYLDCSNNKIEGGWALNGIGMNHLIYLDCSNNGLVLDNSYINGLSSLETLDCSNNNNMVNQVWSWNDFPAIRHFNGNHNLINDLGTIPATLLTLDCSYNDLTALDLSVSTNLVTLNCTNNKFVSVDLKGMTNATAIDCTSNAIMTCVLVDDIDTAAANTNWVKDAAADYALDCSAAYYTLIPDPAFEQALINAGYDNDNGTTIDGRVLTANITSVQNLYIMSAGISDLTGIKAFLSLRTLYCNNNSLTSLDVSGMTHLITLMCYSNTLTTVNVSGMTALQEFNCSSNQLTTLDLTGTGLVSLDCSHNSLTSLNVSGLTLLETLETRYNSLTTLNVNGLTGLKEIYCGDNHLTSINLTGTTLEKLECYNNDFVSLNVKGLPDSAILECYANNNLQCIEVNDVTIAENNTNWLKDSPPIYSLSCTGSTAIPDVHFEQALIDLGYDDVIDGQVATVNIINQAYLGLDNYGISDLTGIQDFVNLTVLHCSKNQITSLDLSPFPDLVQLICSRNLLTSLDLSHSPLLEFLDCSRNQITSLDVTGLVHMIQLKCYDNQITSLDLTALTALLTVECSTNELTSLKVTNMGNLEYIEAYENNLTSLDLTGLGHLEYLDCGMNAITSLDVSNLTNLIEYYCYQNQLTAIDVAGLSNLLAIDCSYNQITNLDESTFTNLQYLGVNNNQLFELDLSGMADLSQMDCTTNPLSCIKVADVAAAEAKPNWYKNISATYNTSCDCSLTTTWDGSAWSPFVPIANQKAIIAGNYTSTADLAVCELEITGTAIVNIAAGHNLTVSGMLTVAPTAKLEFSNNANLLQDPLALINTNSGNIVYNRNSSPLYNLDFTIWSSPTQGSQTLKDFSAGTLDANFYVYNTALNAYSNYQSLSGIFGSNPNAVTFAPAKGYLIRMPAGLPEAATSVFAGQFIGIPNNGNVSIPLNTSGNGFNAVGNPYASPINIHEFIDTNSANMDGTLYFWRKTNNATTSTYATITKLAYNANQAAGGDTGGTAFNGAPDTWVINPGQGFFMKALPTAANLVFNNSMRRAVNNNQFFRTAGANQVQAETPMSRLWLDISNSNSFAQTTVGYTAVTTLGMDYGWDGKLLSDGNVSLYSKTGETKLSIQARPEFSDTDVVPLGYKVNAAGSFTIGLNHFDGVFTEGQDIFLNDKLQNVVHNLKTASYSFASEAGTFDDRFEVMYVNTTLGNDFPELDPNKIVIYKENTSLNINTGYVMMKEVQIFDIRGRLIYSKNTANVSEIKISDLKAEQQMLIIQITTQDNAKVSKKIIY